MEHPHTHIWHRKPESRPKEFGNILKRHAERRMAIMDAMPKPLREAIHEHGVLEKLISFWQSNDYTIDELLRWQQAYLRGYTEEHEAFCEGREPKFGKPLMPTQLPKKQRKITLDDLGL